MGDSIAWAAGFYEGEGTVGCWNNTLVLQINQQDREPLEKFRDIFGGKIYQTKQTATRKTIYAVSLYGQSPVVHAIINMWPFLSARRQRQAADAMDRAADTLALREYYCGTKRHVRTTENTRISNGKRKCRECEREAWKKRTR